MSETPERFRVVETDNYDRDYPDERWATPYTFRTQKSAQTVADAINKALGDSDRWCKVVTANYELNR